MPLQCLGRRKQNLDDHTLCYADALVKTDSKNIQAAAHRRRILFARFKARVEKERLPRTVVFGEMVGGKGCEYSGRKEKDWAGRLKEYLKHFGTGWKSSRGNGMKRRVERQRQATIATTTRHPGTNERREGALRKRL